MYKLNLECGEIGWGVKIRLEKQRNMERNK